jgi:nucleotide-binding universal stress UspA family protein
MRDFRKILFPIAFSEKDDAIAFSVRRIAQRFNAAVTILNACNLAPEYFSGPPSGAPCDSKVSPTLFSRALQERRNLQVRRLREFARTNFSGIGHTERIEIGDPAAVIEWVAKCEKSDVIILSTRVPARLCSFFLGSVISKVLHDANCPVWTIGHKSEPLSALPLGYRSILCTIGMKPEENMVFDVASLFVQIYGARICFLCTQSTSDEPDTESLTQSVKQAFKQVCTSKREPLSPEVCVRILKTNLAEGIRQTALEQGADLTIVGRGRKAGILSRARSQLYLIIRESPCPVLSV